MGITWGGKYYLIDPGRQMEITNRPRVADENHIGSHYSTDQGRQMEIPIKTKGGRWESHGESLFDRPRAADGNH